MSSTPEQSLEDYLPDGPITSLRRLQTLYGALEEGIGRDNSGTVDPEFALYYTPGELEEFVTTDPGETQRYLISVDIDMTGETVTHEHVDVDVDFLTPGKVSRLGFSRFPWGRGIDHSITRRGAKGGSTADTATTYCLDCLERWTNADGREPAVGEVAETHPDGWIIKLLQELGTDEAVQSKLSALLEEKYTEEERVVATVRLKLDPNDLERAPDGNTSEWFYPGEVHVLNAGMKARKDLKLANKNLPPGVYSRGESACMVTGEVEEVFGTTEDPLAFFTVQHAEKFDGIERKQSWRSHPVSANAALLIQSGASLVETCRTTRNGLGVYTLPYFVDMNESRAYTLYAALEELRDAGDDIASRAPMAYLEEVIEEKGEPADVQALRFYVISLRNDSGDINVIHEVPDVSLYWPRKIAKCHCETLDSAFGPVGFEKDSDWQPITPHTREPEALTEILSGRYAWGTMPKMAGDDGAMADDLAEWLTYALLTGQPVPVERLLQGYVDRIGQAYRDRDGRFPMNHVKTQLAQLETLARADLLTSQPGNETLRHPPQMLTEKIPTSEEVAGDGNLSEYSLREYRLRRIIEDRESLASDRHRRSAFVLGAYVGILADHQSRQRNMNRTLVDEYPADRVTIDRLDRLLPKLTQRNKVYANDVDALGDVLFPEYLDVVGNDYVRPTEWELSIDDVRFFYSVGIAHGLRARKAARELGEKIDGAEAAQSTE